MKDKLNLEERLSAIAKQALEAYENADEEFSKVMKEWKELPLYKKVKAAAEARNTAIDSVKNYLKAEFSRLAREDETIRQTRIGDFVVTPDRKKEWNTSKLLNLCNEFGLTEYLFENGALMNNALYYLNEEKFKELPEDITKYLLATGVIEISTEVLIDDAKLEGFTNSEQWEALRSNALTIEVKQVKCATPLKQDI